MILWTIKITIYYIKSNIEQDELPSIFSDIESACKDTTTVKVINVYSSATNKKTADVNDKELFKRDNIKYVYKSSTSECAKLSTDSIELLLEANNANKINFTEIKKDNLGLIFELEHLHEKGKSSYTVISSKDRCKSIAEKEL